MGKLHSKEHSDMIAWLEKSVNPSDTAKKRNLIKMKKWINHHILQIDGQYQELFRKKKTQ